MWIKNCPSFIYKGLQEFGYLTPVVIVDIELMGAELPLKSAALSDLTVK